MAFDGATIGGAPIGGVTVVNVPTLSEYGLVAMAVLLAALGIREARRRLLRREAKIPHKSPPRRRAFSWFRRAAAGERSAAIPLVE